MGSRESSHCPKYILIITARRPLTVSSCKFYPNPYFVASSGPLRPTYYHFIYHNHVRPSTAVKASVQSFKKTNGSTVSYAEPYWTIGKLRSTQR